MGSAPRSLKGLVVVVTGGGRGVGAATVRQLTAQGARVALCDLDASLAERVAQENGALGAGVDVTDGAAFSAFLDRVEQELGPIDVLVNNAGIMPLSKWQEETEETAAAVISVNLLANITNSKEYVRRVIAGDRPGHVVNVSSTAAYSPLPGASTYTASKFALTGLTQALHYEFRSEGVPVTMSAVHPVLITTELAAGLKPPSRGPFSVSPEQVAESIVHTIRKPKLIVFSPSVMGPVLRAGSLNPQWLADFLMTKSGGDRAVLDAVASPERRDYESRVAQSASAADKEQSA
jgi:NAD(P)-dependent dehydrogenase (short-subunit alcohol dehydrogenase family)